jgi:hypothetical protein
MILHIVKDGRLINTIIDQFEKVAPGESYYLVDTTYEGKLLRTEPSERFQFAKKNSKEYFDLLKQYKNVTSVIIHSMTDFHAYLINKYLYDKKICWTLWGGDIYQSGFIPYEKNILVQTKKQIKKDLWQTIKSAIGRNRWRFPILFSRYRAMLKVDYLITVLPSEYEHITSNIPKLRAKQVLWNYSLEQSFIYPNIVNNNRKNIIVSHNGYPTNNHFDSFEILKKLDLQERRIIVPLSYGIKDYSNKVLKYGESVFGSSFMPLIDYLSFEKYIEIVNSCSIALFNNIRQQGVGNLIILLKLGIKIYLNENGMAWKFMQDLGIKVFSINKDINNIDALEPLDIEIAKSNRKKIEEFINIESLDKKTLNLINLLK